MSKDYDIDKIRTQLSKISTVAIGPFTADELEKLKIKNTVSKIHTIAGAFETIKKSQIAV